MYTEKNNYLSINQNKKYRLENILDGNSTNLKVARVN